MGRALAPRGDEAEITDFVATWFLPQTLKIFAEDCALLALCFERQGYCARRVDQRVDLAAVERMRMPKLARKADDQALMRAQRYG
jgi:hypothetical protein